MATTEIRLTPENQKFSITLAGRDYGMRVTWRGSCWYLDLFDSSDTLIIGSIPLITGADLLAQYRHLGLSFSLYVICDVDGQENPTESDLGITSHLYVVTEEDDA